MTQSQLDSIAVLHMTTEQKEQILPFLGTADGLIDFVVMNNLNGVRTILLDNGINPTDSSETGIFATVKNLYNTKNPIFWKVINNTPYINDANNITGGLEDFLIEVGKQVKTNNYGEPLTVATADPNAKIDWLGGLFAGIGSFFGSLGGGTGGTQQNPNPYGVNPDTGIPFQSQAEVTAYQMQKAQESAKRKKLAWIIGGSIGGVILILIAVSVIKGMKTKKTATA